MSSASKGLGFKGSTIATFLAIILATKYESLEDYLLDKLSPSPQIEATGVQPAPAFDDKKVAAMRIVLDPAFGTNTPEGQKLAESLAELSAPARSK